ncbi:MAG: ABC transporter permease [Candidatus Hodarchaeota archaeon]
MIITVYRKEARKSIISGILPSILMGVTAIMMFAVWPTFKKEAADFQELLDAPIYQAMLSKGAISAGIGTYEGFMGMELFTMLDFMYLFLPMFVGVNIISREVDKKTLDITLSYPISRWKIPLGRFATVNSYALTIPLFVFVPLSLGAIYLNEDTDHLALLIALLSKQILFFALTAISLLCASLFLNSKSSYGAAGGIIIGSYILKSLGGLVYSLNLLRNLSLFHYLDGTSIWVTGTLPFDELIIVLGVGIIALISSLMIFQHRELTY